MMELLTVVTVIGILASIAIPSYRLYLLRAQRSDGTTALLRLASAQEKHMMQYGVYVTTTANIPNAHSAGGLGIPATSDRGFYALTLAATATGYDATATPVAGRGQADDLKCASFTVNESGTRRAVSSTGTNTTNDCFR
jgi:type IV pilus assembly protein PilE